MDKPKPPTKSTNPRIPKKIVQTEERSTDSNDQIYHHPLGCRGVIEKKRSPKNPRKPKKIPSFFPRFLSNQTAQNKPKKQNKKKSAQKKKKAIKTIKRDTRRLPVRALNQDEQRSDPHF